MYSSAEFLEAFPGVSEFLEVKGFPRKYCAQCRRPMFGLADRCHQCDQPRTFAPVSQVTLGDTWRTIKGVLQKRGYTLVTSCSVQNDITIKRTSHRFAGICHFIPQYTDGLLRLKGKIVNLQQCIRLDDLENIGTSGRHWTSFNMMGAMRFGQPVGDTAMLQDLLVLLAEMGYKYQDLLISLEPWSDGIHEGMGIEIHRGGVELLNQVHTFLLSGTQQVLSPALQYIDTGLGLERCHNGVSSRTVQISLAFDHTRTALALIYSGVYGSKRGAGYTVRRLRANLRNAKVNSVEVLKYCYKIREQNEQLGRPNLDEAEFMNEWVLL